MQNQPLHRLQQEKITHREKSIQGHEVGYLLALKVAQLADALSEEHQHPPQQGLGISHAGERAVRAVEFEDSTQAASDAQPNVRVGVFRELLGAEVVRETAKVGDARPRRAGVQKAVFVRELGSLS